jgi:ribonuclease VapC
VIVDSSAIISVLLREPDHKRLVDALASADRVGVGGPTLAETGMVLVARLGIPGKSLLARFVQEVPVDVVAVGPGHWTVAVDAFARYGKGRHRAALNFGDCLTYAVARIAAEPLLCVGDDFPCTDLELADW